MTESPQPELSPALAPPYVRIIETLCGESDFHAAADALVEEVRAATECESVSLRVYDHREDYPFLAHAGFDETFINRENSVCAHDSEGRTARHEDGAVVLECMCGMVVRGAGDLTKPYFTPYGSFWTNDMSAFAASTPAGEICDVMRDSCRARGYESISLVPLRAGGRTVGLIQTNSRTPGRITPSVLAFLERVARHTGAAVDMAWRREELGRLSREFEEHRRGVETMVALGEMAATLAHEIKNPLAGMMLSASRLRKALAGQEKLSSIAQHLCTSIDSLSDTVTRVGRTVREPKLERIAADVNEVLESALSFVAPRASEQGVAIVRDLATGLPAIIADKNYLMRAFLNLIVNALDAMPSGGTLRLMSALTGDGDIRIIIGDTGPGLGEIEVESLFRPFETNKPGGTGLGLGIVRRIIDIHAGTVTLRPGAGGGTEAVVILNPRGDRVQQGQVRP